MKNIINRKKIVNEISVLLTLTKRHFKMFFKNKVGLGFAILVPLITLIIYIVFLRQIQLNAIDNTISQVIGKTITDATKTKSYLIADTWMLSGIISVSCISVSLNTCNIAVIDKSEGVNKDFMSSPISRRSINLSYLIFNFIATSLIISVVVIVAFIYLGIAGGFLISASNILLIFLVMLLSVFSASLITCFISSFVTTFNTFNSLNVIISSAAGFLIGAFMPASMLPGKAARILTLCFPGTYSTGLFRQFMMDGYIVEFEKQLETVEQISPSKIAELKSQLDSSLSINVDFFGTKLNSGYMVLAVLCFVALFIILNIVFLDRNFVNSVQGKISLKSNKKLIKKNDGE